MTPSKGLGQVVGDLLSDADVAGIEINGLSVDSRSVAEGYLFFAYPGATADGRHYFSEALARGASAVLTESEGKEIRYLARVPLIPVNRLREKVGVVAERFYDNPCRDLFVVGVTGTNGKTSCAHLLAQSLQTEGIRAAFIGTLGWGFIGDLKNSALTTPDPVTLHRMLRDLRELGATHVCMEVSSHALAQGRVSGMSFDAALFTNLTHDHLDYHDGLEDYAAAKEILFRFPSLRFAVINGDDDFGRDLAARVSVPVWVYGFSKGDVTLDGVSIDVSGLSLVIKYTEIYIKAHAPLVGRINVRNVLAVAAVLLANGAAGASVAAAIDQLAPVPGRMELFPKTSGIGPSVVVDYAHTPDALERALSSVREHCKGRIWCVFGCGGDRDRVKRPMMGAIAERLSDEVIVTDDNPRHESPGAITDEIIQGMSEVPMVINDRVEAIRRAIEGAADGDWILIAGKGHEDTQQVGDEFLPMNDRSIVSSFLGVAA